MSDPALTLVTITDGAYEVCRRSICHFARQTRLDDVELIIICESTETLGEPDQDDLAGFHSVQTVPIGPLASTGHGLAAGVHAARAPLVGYMEEHSFLPANFVDVVLDEMKDPTIGALGYGMVPANPGLVAWAHMFIQFAPAVAPVVAGNASVLGGHHAVYRREVLLGYEDSLVDITGNEAVLHEDMRHRGVRMVMTDRLTAEHTQISRLGDLVKQEFISQRAFAVARSRVLGWSPVRRAVYALGSPLIPFLRVGRTLEAIRRSGRGKDLMPQILGPMMLGALAGGAGEGIGYLFGGLDRAYRARLDYELHRYDYVTSADRRSLPSVPERKIS